MSGNKAATMTPKDNLNDAKLLDANANLTAAATAAAAEEEECDEDELRELSKLRCTSLRTEEVAKRQKEKREREVRRNRCPDYPGLAFGSTGYGSDTMMKFNIIKNELHNIMKSQLRRVDGEVAAMSKRIRELDENLEKSEQFIKTATVALAEAVQFEMDHRKEDEEEENALSQFDAQLKLLEGKLAQAKLLAEEARGLDTTGPISEDEKIRRRNLE